MKRLLFLVMFLILPTLAFAQEPPPGELPVGLLGQIIAFVLSAAGLTAIGQLIRGLNVSVPGVVKPFLPPLFGLLAGLVNQHWGLVVDFGPILGVLMGTLSVMMFDVGKERGWLKSSSG